MRKIVVFFWILAVLGILSARSKFNESTIKAELRKPGVKLVAVDFYMTGCPPCDKAIKKWKELKNQYGEALKLIVVAPTRSDGSCNVKEWYPDIIKCDDDSEIAGSWGVRDFPQAFLYSWDKDYPLLEHGQVKDVEKKIKEYLKNIPRVVIDADKNTKNLVPLIEEELIRNSKIELVANESERDRLLEEKERSTNDNYDDDLQCIQGKEISANSVLKVTKQGSNLVLKLSSVESSCTKAVTTKHLSGDKKKLKTEITSAVYDLLLQIFGHISVPQEERNTSFQTGRFGGKTDDWEIGGGEETIVKFESNPTGAVVMADGKLLCQSTPCSKTLTQGNHNIEMQMENYVPVSKKEEIKEGKVIKYTLEPDFAWLWVTGNRNVQLKLDGKDIGEIPIKEKQITPGNHKIEHSDRCFYDSGENFTIKRGEKKTIKFNLEPRESAIKVNAQDEKGNDVDADVFVDDKKVGRAPGTFKIPLCSKEMRVKKEGFAEYSEILELKEKKVIEFHAKLKSDNPAMREFDGAPKWVLIGDDYSPNESCSVEYVMKPKTEKLMMEKVTQKAEIDLAMRLSNMSVMAKQLSDTMFVQYTKVIILPHTLNQVAKKRFIKDTWKSPNGNIYVLVCVKHKEVESLYFEADLSLCEKIRKKQGLLPWAEYLENYPDGVCASEAAANIEKYKKQNEKKDLAEIEKRRKKTGKYWSDTAHYKMNYNDARKYCENLDEGGFDDWRLPTIDELRSLVQNCKDTVTKGTCNITDSCSTEDCFEEALEKSDCWCPLNKAIYSKLGDKGTFVSDSYFKYLDSDSEPMSHAFFRYFLNFDSGGVLDFLSGEGSCTGCNLNEIPLSEILVPYNVRCVR